MNLKSLKNLSFCMLLAGTTLFTACKDDDKLPPIDGFNNSDEIASSALIAKWTFDSNNNETKSGTAPTGSQGVSSTTGIKGNGAKFDKGYLVYPSITSLSSTLGSFSISTWVKVQNNGTSSSIFLSLTRPNEWAGNINFMAETGWAPATNDSITFKGLIVSDNEFGWQDTRNAVTVSAQDAADGHIANGNPVGGEWAHAVLTFDGPSRVFQVYSNGVKISNPKWEVRGAEGMVVNFFTPTYPVIGATRSFAAGTPVDNWDSGLTGELDEMRVYNRALTAAEIGSLYKLEKAGR